MTKEAAKFHLTAAEYYGKAANAHLKACDAYKEGKHLEAASFALIADGFAADAEEAKLEAHKEHRDEFADGLGDDGEVHG